MIPNSARPKLKESQQRKHIYSLWRLRVLLILPLFVSKLGFLAVRLEVVPVPLIWCLRSPLRNLPEAGDTLFYPAYFFARCKNCSKVSSASVQRCCSSRAENQFAVMMLLECLLNAQGRQRSNPCFSFSRSWSL